jgi:hypothetical protein
VVVAVLILIVVTVTVMLGAQRARTSATDRCERIAPAFPARVERITVDWQLFPPAYDCVYWFRGRVFLRKD